MEIKPNTHIDPVRYRPANPSKARPSQTPTDSAHFEESDALNRGLQANPEVRPEAVARARQLIGDASYPPPHAIQSMAALLAEHLDGDAPK